MKERIVWLMIMAAICLAGCALTANADPVASATFDADEDGWIFDWFWLEDNQTLAADGEDEPDGASESEWWSDADDYMEDGDLFSYCFDMVIHETPADFAMTLYNDDDWDNPVAAVFTEDGDEGGGDYILLDMDETGDRTGAGDGLVYGNWYNICIVVDRGDADKADVYVDDELAIWHIDVTSTAIVQFIRAYSTGGYMEIDNTMIYDYAYIQVPPDFNPPPAVDAGPDQVLWSDQLPVQLAGAISDADPADGSYEGDLTFYWVQISDPNTATATFDPEDTTNVLDPTVTFDGAGTYEILLQATDGDKDANDIMTIVVLDAAGKAKVAHWDMEDIVSAGSGPYVIPEEYGNDGVYVTGWERVPIKPTVVPGIIGDDAIRFIGNEEHMLNPFSLPRVTGTLSHWCKTASDKQQAIYFESDSETNGFGGRDLEIHSGADDGEWMFLYADNDDADRVQVWGGNAVVGEWSHVVATWNIYGDLILYVNGVEVESTVIGSAGGGNIEPGFEDGYVLVGGVSDIEHERMYEGDVDDIRVYNYDMTPEEVRALAASVDLPPTVDAGDDREEIIRLTTEITLDGTMVDYGAPSTKTYLWAQVEGPGTVEFTTADALSTVVTFDAFGVYVLSLTVSDAGGSRTDTIEIDVVETDCSDVEAAGLMYPGDISGPDGAPDCRVDLYDVAAYAENFLRCMDPQDENCDDPYNGG